MFVLMASPVIKLCCSNRLLSSSLLLPAKDWLLYHRGSQRVCPRLRLRQFHLPGLVALSISLAHLPSYGTRPLKFWGVEGIRGLFGSGISTSSSLDACPEVRHFSAHLIILQSDWNDHFSFANANRILILQNARITLAALRRTSS